MTLWKYTLREMQRRPTRTLLTLLGIVIGVGAVVGIMTTAQATRRAYREMFESVTGRASLEIVADGLGGFDPASVANVAAVPGVRAAVPVIQAPAGLVGPSGAVPVLLLGIDPELDGAARVLPLQQGQILDKRDGVLLEAGFARNNGLALDGSARLLTARGIVSLPVVGLLELRGPATFNGGAVVFLPLPTAQRLLGLSGRINSLQLVLEDGASAEAIANLIGPQLPAGLSVQPPAARGELAQENLFSTEQSLACLSVASLVAGAFVILNTFLMNLGERQRQLAILRALGVTRGQLTRLLLREALALGVAGTLLGIPAGLGMAVLLQQVMEQLTGVKMPGLHLTPAPFLAAAVLGPGVALAATWFPVRRAGRRSPLESLFGRQATRPTSFPTWSVVTGLVLLAAVRLVEAGILRGWFPPALYGPLLAPTMATNLAGCVLALPLLFMPLTRLVARLLHPWLGVPGRLAFRQLLRQPNRTALTAGILVLSVAMSVSFGNLFQGGVRLIHEWYERTIPADFLVRGFTPDTGFLFTAEMPEPLAEEIAALEGVEHVDRINFVMGRARAPDGSTHRIVILVRDFPTGRPLHLDLNDGEPEDVLRRLRHGEAVAGGALAKRLQARPGEDVVIETGQGPQPVRLAATATEYTVGGMALYLDWETGKRLLNVHGAHALEVVARPGAATTVAGPLRELCARRGLIAQPNADLLAMIDRNIDGVNAFLRSLMVLVFVVASLGIINTLTMNVHEQTRELGVLRALGMKRSQVGRMVLSQALILGALSVLPGVAIGLTMQYMMQLVSDPVLGVRLTFRIDIGFVLLCSVSALLVAVLAALFPARVAARLPVIQALQYE
jgi:putative ABC transport system permease protein